MPLDGKTADFEKGVGEYEEQFHTGSALLSSIGATGKSL
jgi:hypothetical protein